MISQNIAKGMKIVKIEKSREHNGNIENIGLPVLYLVVPCYNEEAVLVWSAAELLAKIKQLITDEKISVASKVLFVDDGSKDSTWRIIEEQHQKHPLLCGIQLSKNEGHQYALFAGLMFAKDHSDLTISIDADLQQDIHAVDRMLEQYRQGADIVYGIRNDRKTDGLAKKLSALGFYKLMQWMGSNVIKNHADYRLLSKRAMESLAQYQESNLFLRGLIPKLGYRTATVNFNVRERTAGQSKYTLSKMIKLAADGITSFSIRPMEIIMGIGFAVVVLSILMVLSTIVAYCMEKTSIGWPTIVCSIWFLGGVQLVALGVIGEYIGKTYLETKHRPKYHVQSILWGDEAES